MTDIRIAFDGALLSGDFLQLNSQLDTDKELLSAIAISLFTDRLADADDPLPSDTDKDRRGWWGDWDASDIHRSPMIGSRLWLLRREKQTEQTRLRAETYIREALQWLIRDRVASHYDLNVIWFAHERLGCELTVYRDLKDPVHVRYAPLWDQVAHSG